MESTKEQQETKSRSQGQEDPTASERKRDHIELAFRSQVERGELDDRFYYEPLLAAHPKVDSLPSFTFLEKTMRVPIWVSSMTGGTEWAGHINHNLARACREFGMGMGLGSCRALLHSDEYLADFDVRPIIGDDLPLFANLGIAQLEQLLINGKLDKLPDLLARLRADGLIVHVNPLQEWLQPEGDRFHLPPIQTIESLLEKVDFPVIVKEVGQGMGRESLKALFKLPLAAVDFAAHGGTNFARLELLRNDPGRQAIYEQLAFIGHRAEEMVEICNVLVDELKGKMACQQVIVSGGVGNFLDGYYLTQKIRLPAVYGQASAFLRHARGDYEELRSHIEAQVRGLELAHAFLKCKA